MSGEPRTPDAPVLAPEAAPARAPASDAPTDQPRERPLPPLDTTPGVDPLEQPDMSKNEPDQPPQPDVPADEEQPKRGRLSRLRFTKKKDMPGGLWLKCESCGQTIYKKDLEENVRVCPACSFHFTLPGKERVASFLDDGTWRECFDDIRAMDRLEFVENATYGEKLERAVTRAGQNEAFLVGTGRVEGRELVLGILDFAFLGGSMGEVVGEKISLAVELAEAKGLPLVLFTSSGGARMHEGAISLMQMAKTSAALARFNRTGGFSICVMTHPTTGGVTASFASVCDIILAEPGALIGFAGPRVIATTIKQELPPGFQRAECLIDKGMVDAIVSRSDLRRRVASLLHNGAGARAAADARRELG